MKVFTSEQVRCRINAMRGRCLSAGMADVSPGNTCPQVSFTSWFLDAINYAMYTGMDIGAAS
jgi:hypothetical protein